MNSGLPDCVSLAVTTKKQCFWDHLTLGNPLYLVCGYCGFVAMYLLCVCKVYREQEHMKQELSVSYKHVTMYKEFARMITGVRVPFAEKRSLTSYERVWDNCYVSGRVLA